MTAQRVGATPTAIQPPLCPYIVTQCLNICLEGLHPLPEFSPRSDFAYEISEVSSG